jgi:acyl-CoA hydrolase/GNAT superfamily N-acetyltransferase
MRGWRERFEKKFTTAAQACMKVGRGGRVYFSSGCGLPKHLFREIWRQAGRLADTEILHLLSVGSECLYDCREYEERLRLNTCFIGKDARKAISNGRADYTPVSLSDLPRLVRNGIFQVGVAMIHVTPPDQFGYCSLGISVETARAFAAKAPYVVAQLNPRMPRTMGSSHIHVDKFHAVVPYEEELIEWQPQPPDELTLEICRNAARLIDDGSTLQVGIGKVPDSLLGLLKNHKDLGIHTEMFSDGLLDLIESGAVTNDRKTLHPGKVVATFCMGTRRLYDYIDGNHMFEFYDSDYVADPFVIAQNEKMVSVNTGVEVDLTGQVCADSIGHCFISGIGSHADFVRGAARSKGGKSIIALPSTAKSGDVSRIVATLTCGGGAATTRSDVQYVVTEYGIAHLEGRTIRERALELIMVAHPRFREDLLRRAKELKYVYADQKVPGPHRQVDFKQWMSEHELPNGECYRIRLVKPTDERGLQRLLYSLSEADVRNRFMSAGVRFPHRETQSLAVIDYSEQVAFVAVRGGPPATEILGIGQYFLHPTTRMAEVGFVVHENWRRMRIGTALLEALTNYARESSVAGFRAEILSRNRAMMALFHTCGQTMYSAVDDDMYSLWYRFGEDRSAGAEPPNTRP